MKDKIGIIARAYVLMSATNPELPLEIWVNDKEIIGIQRDPLSIYKIQIRVDILGHMDAGFFDAKMQRQQGFELLETIEPKESKKCKHEYVYNGKCEECGLHVGSMGK